MSIYYLTLRQRSADDAVADSDTLHSNIASQLRQMLQVNPEDDEVSCRDWQGGMSVTEKMRMWASKPQDLDATPVDASECFQGVGEDVDERTNDPALLTYGRAILQSKAYEWLIQRLLKESSFSWGHGPRIMVDEIRSSILRSLPAGRISKNRDPDIHRAEFRMPLSQVRQRLFRENQKTGTTWDWKDVSTTVVLVSSSDDCILAIRVEEYIDQTWSKDMGLLTKFRVALEQALSDTDAIAGKCEDLHVACPLERVTESRCLGASADNYRTQVSQLPSVCLPRASHTPLRSKENSWLGSSPLSKIPRMRK